MKVKPLLGASLIGTALLLSACADVLDSPEDALPPPVDLGNPAPGPAPAPTPAATIPTKAQLLGSWLLTRENGAAVTSVITVTFLSDNTYIQGGEQNATACNPTPANAGTFANYDGAGNGVEFGEYVYNETTGSIRASDTVFFIDSNGDCGLHEASSGATQDAFNLTLNAGVLRLAEPGGGFSAEFTRIERGTGVTGSWYVTGSSEGDPDGGNPVVLSLLGDGRFVLLCPEPELPVSVTNTGADSPGAQVGRYALDAAGNLTLSSVTTNTASCSLGPVDGDGNPSGNSAERLTVNGAGELVYSYIFNSAAESASFSSLPLANRFDTSLLTGLWYDDNDDDGSPLGEISPNILFFGPSNLFLSGALNNDTDCVTPYAGTGVAVETNANGYERGTVSADATTGRLTFAISDETDGACGAYDRTRLNQRLYLTSLTSTRASARVTTEEEELDPDAIVRPLPSSTGGLFGGWRGTTGAAGTAADDFLVAYYDDATAGAASGIYIAVDANPASTCSLVDSGPAGGFEIGQYTFDGTTAIYTSSTSTLCQTRFDPNGTQTISFTPDFLRYTDNQASTPAASFVYNKLTRP